MAERVTELAPFVDAARRFRRDMAGDSARKAELLEQLLHAASVLADIGIDLAVCAFEIRLRDQCRAAVARPDDIDHVEVVALDDPVQMQVQHIQSGRCAPMPEQTRLDMLALERHFEERIVEQIDLPDRKVIRGPPVCIHLVQLVGGERPAVAGDVGSLLLWLAGGDGSGHCDFLH